MLICVFPAGSNITMEFLKVGVPKERGGRKAMWGEGAPHCYRHWEYKEADQNILSRDWDLRLLPHIFSVPWQKRKAHNCSGSWERKWGPPELAEDGAAIQHLDVSLGSPAWGSWPTELQGYGSKPLISWSLLTGAIANRLIIIVIIITHYY